MYHVRKNLFKDYLWEGGNSDTHSPIVNSIAPYDNKYWWFDPRYTEADARWYIGNLLASLKDISLRKHRFTFIDPMGNKSKKGACIQTGADDNTQYIQYLESAREVPPSVSGGAIRPGFLGQYGIQAAMPYTGTMYEFSSIWSGPSMIAEQQPSPTPGNYGPVGPYGMSIYADGGIAPTRATDGIHVHLVPKNSFIWVDVAGVRTQINGPCIVVATGTLQPYALDHIATFTTFDNGDAIDLEPDTEYWLRLAYWPQQESLKQIPQDDPYDGTQRKDRRLMIWMSENDAEGQVDKLHIGKYVGIASLIEKQYTSQRNYIYLFAYDYYQDDEETVTAYDDAVIQFDEPVVGTEWLPYDEGEDIETYDGKSYMWLKYKKEPSELTHDPTAASGQVPTFKVGDEIEVWAFMERIQAQYKRLYKSIFDDAFPDGWTVTNTSGAITQEDTPIDRYRESFVEDYADKGNDPNWTVNAGVWDTTTVADRLSNTGAGSIQSDQIACGQDFYFKIQHEFTGDAANDLIYLFGYNGAAVVNSALRLSLRASDNRILLEERRAGAWVSIDSTVAYEPEGVHVIEVVRMGGRVKVYMDGTLILDGGLAFTACTNNEFLIQTVGAVVVELSLLLVQSTFPDSYALSVNTAGTNVDGEIYRSLAPTYSDGSSELHVTMYDAYSSYAGVAGAAFTKVHYDNGAAGTNWMGFGIYWDGTTRMVQLHDASASFEVVGDPDFLPIAINDYTVNKFVLKWYVEADVITRVSLFSGHDGQFMGTIACNHALPGNLRLEHEFFCSIGSETPYYEQTDLIEMPSIISDYIDVPISHHVVKRPMWSDNSGAIIVEARSMDYGLRGLEPVDGNNYESEDAGYTDQSLLEVLLQQHGDEWNRWLHYWNIDVSLLPGTWIEHRLRGNMWMGILKRLMDYAGVHWYVTPEMQFLIDNDYRNFYTTDCLRIGDAVPQGIHLHEDNFEKSQLNYIIGLTRIDDDSAEVRGAQKRMQPVDFVEDRNPTIVIGGQQMVGSQNAANPMSQTTVQDTSRVPVGGGRSLPMGIESQVGAENAVPATITGAQVTAFHTTIARSHLTSMAHMNQLPVVTLFGCKPWYRPMDQLQFKHAEWNPEVEDTTSPDQAALYVIQKAVHTLHKNHVEYQLGRRENVDGVAEVDGHGPVTGNQLDMARKTKDQSDWAEGLTNL